MIIELLIIIFMTQSTPKWPKSKLYVTDYSANVKPRFKKKWSRLAGIIPSAVEGSGPLIPARRGHPLFGPHEIGLCRHLVQDHSRPESEYGINSRFKRKAEKRPLGRPSQAKCYELLSLDLLKFAESNNMNI